MQSLVNAFRNTTRKFIGVAGYEDKYQILL